MNDAIGLAMQAWESRHAVELEEALRKDPDLMARAKALGIWTETIARIEADPRYLGAV